MSNRSKPSSKRGSRLEKEVTVECFLELEPVLDNHDSAENNVCEDIQPKASSDSVDMRRGLSDATQNYLETRQNLQKELRMKAKGKLYFGFFIAGIVLVVLWVGYLVTAAFFAYGQIERPEITHEEAFNATYQQTEQNCSDRSTSYILFREFVSALERSNYTQSSVNVTDCPTDFITNTTHCTPECLEFTPGGRGQWWAFRITTIFGSSFTLVATVIGMFSWVNKELWKFPKVVNFYMMISVFLQAVAILSGALVPKPFYCKHTDIFESREDSTIYCLVQGGLMHYALLAFLIWYIFSISNLSVIVLSPLKGATWFFKYIKVIHITQLVVGWGLPFVVVLLNFAVSGAIGQIYTTYAIGNAPEFCLPGINIVEIVTLYILGFIFSLFNGTMIVIIVCKMLHLKYRQSRITTSTIVSTEWVFQLSIFTIVFSLSIWVVLMDASVYEYFLYKYRVYLDIYISCISIFPESCCEAVYQSVYVPWLSTLGGFSTCVWGIGGLAAVTNKEVRQFWKKVLTCKYCRKH